MDSLLVSLIVGLIYGGIAVGIYFLLFPPFEKKATLARTTSVEKRLKEIKQKKFTAIRSGEDVFKKLESKSGKQKENLIEMLKDSNEYKLYFLGLIFSKFRFTNTVKKLLKSANVKMPIDLFMMMVIMLFVPFFILTIIKGSPLFLLIGLCAASAPFVFLKMKIQNNLKLFTMYFSDALTLISNSLKAGHSLLASFQLVADESPYPVNKLFKGVADDVSLGREIREALEEMCNNMEGSEDLKFFVTAVLVQKEIGGNLTEILDTLNTTIRERFKLFGMIKTQTSQAKMSGIVLALVPVIITGLVSMMNPAYMAPLFNSTGGNMVLGAALLLSGIGFLIINKITDIRV